MFSFAEGLAGLWISKTNFPLLGLTGLLLALTIPSSESLLAKMGVETVATPETGMRAGLVLGVVTVGVVLPGVVGDTRPWTVQEIRAETVTRLRS